MNKAEGEQKPADTKSLRYRGIHLLRFRPDECRYGGAVQSVIEEWSTKTGRSETTDNPWMRFPPLARKTSTPFSAIDALAQEVKDFEVYLTPVSEELAAADNALEDLQDAIKMVDPALTASMIGSRANSLARPLSDIDVNLSTPDFPISQLQTKSPWSRKARNKARKLITEVHQALMPDKRGGGSRFRPEELVLRTKVQITIGHHVSSGLKYQVQCTTSAPQSLEYAKLYLKEIPTLRPIFWVVQQMLQMRGLTDGSKQGVGSYTLLMMIVAALKLGQDRYKPHDVGSQLMHVLDFYSDFDFYENGIIVQPPLLINRVLKHDVFSNQHDVASPAAHQMFYSKRREERPYLMVLQDPADLHNNLGSNVFNIKHIQATIKDVKDKLETSMRVWTTFKTKGVQAQPQISLLSPLVGGNYATFQETRSKLRSFGNNHKGRTDDREELMRELVRASARVFGFDRCSISETQRRLETTFARTYSTKTNPPRAHRYRAAEKSRSSIANSATPLPCHPEASVSICRVISSTREPTTEAKAKSEPTPTTSATAPTKSQVPDLTEGGYFYRRVPGIEAGKAFHNPLFPPQQIETETNTKTELKGGLDLDSH